MKKKKEAEMAGRMLGLGSNGHIGRDFKIIAVTGGESVVRGEYLGEIRRRLQVVEYQVYLLGDVGRKFSDSGLVPSADPELAIKSSLALENCFVEAVKRHPAEKKVCLVDLGIMSNVPYIGAENFDRILRSLGLSRLEVRNRRYDAVFHLRSSIPEDDKICEAWLGHHHLRVIPVMADEGKRLDLLWRNTERVLGIPKPLEIERKFLVEVLADPLPVASVTLNITQNYLKKRPDGTRPRLRLVSEPGFHSASAMYLTVKKKIAGSLMSKEEREEEIDNLTYISLLEDSDPTRKTIFKPRTYFVYADQYFELDKFSSPYRNLVMDEIELLDEGDAVLHPDFIRIKEEVTGNSKYSNSSIAKMSLGPNPTL